LPHLCKEKAGQVGGLPAVYSQAPGGYVLSRVKVMSNRFAVLLKERGAKLTAWWFHAFRHRRTYAFTCESWLWWVHAVWTPCNRMSVAQTGSFFGRPPSSRAADVGSSVWIRCFVRSAVSGGS